MLNPILWMKRIANILLNTVRLRYYKNAKVIDDLFSQIKSEDPIQEFKSMQRTLTGENKFTMLFIKQKEKILIM